MAAGAGVPGAAARARQPDTLQEAIEDVLDEAIEGESDIPQGVDLRTIAEAEKLARLQYTNEQREQVLRTIDRQLGLIDFQRTIELRNEDGPAEVFDPRLPGMEFETRRRRAVWRNADPGPLPQNEEDIAFAPAWALSHWVRTRRLSSEDLTKLYIGRLKRLDPKLECVVTLMEDQALAQARRADEEIRAGRWRGPLHGLPWGAKDLFDTSGVRTTWGAAPYKDRVPDRDARVVQMLDEAGAVLVAKLTLGALAYGDLWFGGRTNNPWNLEQGSSGSSAGSAAAVAAGLCAFTLGTETYGSIGSPSARCGATGFRPTFGRVSRHGAMALCWSLDKVGPICRCAEDCAMVLDAIDGPDAHDRSTRDIPLNIDMTRSIEGMRIGYSKAEYKGRTATDADRETLKALEKLGAKLTPIDMPQGPFGGAIFFLIGIEAAAAFDELTRSGQDEQMRWQDDAAWPNTFRMARLAPAVEYVQAQRIRGRLMRQTAALYENIDAVIAPTRHGAMHAITNMTGHPAITLRQGFREDGTPFAVTLWGRLYEDAALLRLGHALEMELDLWRRRPSL
ncbi:MAG: amidase [Phycisphaeraceae bacterium]|nr:MAG: amidase [Phycisphaeraceae bacterium]